jgi:hypothetical protein
MFFAEMMVGIFFYAKCKISPSIEYLNNKSKFKREVNYKIKRVK